MFHFSLRHTIDARQSLHCSPPGYPPSRLLIIVNWSVNWFACIQRSTCTFSRTSPSCKSHANPFLWIGLGFHPQNWLPQQRTLKDRKANFRSFMYNHSSTNPANLVRIGWVDVEINWYDRIVKFKQNKYETVAEHISPPSAAFRAAQAGYSPGGLINMNCAFNRQFNAYKINK